MSKHLAIPPARQASILLVCATLLVWPSASVRLAASPSRDDSPNGAVTLKKEIASLSGFSGSWSCQGVFPSNGKTIESKMSFAPDLEGAWLTVRHDDLPPNRYHASEYWGYDLASQQFVAFFFDNFGGVRKFTSPGWTDNQWIWTSESTKADPPVVQRFVFRRDKPTQFVVNYEIKKGTADWLVGDTLTCRKS